VSLSAAPSTALRAGSRWDPAAYAANAAFVPAMGAPVLALLDPRPGERVLDLGCGDGVLTERIAAAGAEVIGVDASPAMVEAARARGLDARVADGQALAFGPEFDAAFSNAALHWMLEPAAVAAGVFAALKPGGRFVGEMGGHGNVAAIWRAVHAVLAERGHPVREQDTHWYPTPDAFAAIYAAAGFADIHAELIPRPTPLATGIAGWVMTFRSGLFDIDAIPSDEQQAIAIAVEQRLETELHGPDGWVADYVRLRFTMRKP
jgi:trans-aconitate methyltransferase